MARIFYQQDCDLNKLNGKTVAIIGYGSQGHAHALNLKESGVKVIVGLYEGSKSWAKAEKQGLQVMTAFDAAKAADLIMILINDEKQAKLYKESIEPNLTEGKTLAFAHGFNIHFGCIKPPKNVNVIMVAPKGPGHTVRSEYQVGKGVPCLIAVEQDATGDALEIGLAYAAGIGGARAGVLETNFRTETETDLFGEQAVLCGGVCALESVAVGRAAVENAVNGVSGKMMTFVRTSNEPYNCVPGYEDIDKIANMVRTVPDSFINERGNGITDEGVKYLLPLIEGESYPEYKNGLPVHISLK